VVSTVVLGNDPVNPLAVLILNGLDAGPHLLRNMRAEERPDGVALPASRFGDLGGGRTVFPPQKFLPCCPRGAWISSWIPRLLPSSSCPAGSGAVGVFAVRESFFGL